MPKVSIVVVNTNELHHLHKCLPSIYAQEYPDFELILVDNVSKDGSLDFVRTQFPQTRIIENERNLGYAGANNVGFEHAGGEYIVVLNPDTQLLPGFLSALVEPLENRPEIGLATPKILLMDQPEQINACGNEISYTGLTFCRGLEQPAWHYAAPEIISAVSGAAFVIRRSVLDEIGGFDENFFIYYEETDLSLRAMLAGYSLLYVPAAVVFHKYAFRFSPKKCFYQERNRYYSLFKVLRWRTIGVLLPEILLSELLAWGYAALQGPEHVKSKFKSWVWLSQNRTQVFEARRKVQHMRRVNDSFLLQRFSHRLTFAQTARPGVARALEALINPLVFSFSRAVQWIVIW